MRDIDKIPKNRGDKYYAEGMVIAGPAGLHRGDLMYRWDKIQTIFARHFYKSCLLCHAKINVGERMKIYTEGSNDFVIHEGCFYTYRDIIRVA